MQIRDKRKPGFKFDNSLENNCIHYLETYHRGKENAIIHKLLATRMNTSHRKVRALVSHLVREHSIPIGSLSNSGIFFLANKKEMEKAHAELMSRSGKIIDRAFALKQAFRKYYEDYKKPRLFKQ